MAKPSTDRPLALSAAALWAFGLLFLEQACLGVTEAVRPGAMTDVVNHSACVTLATSAVIFAMMRVHSPDGSLRAALGVQVVGPLRLLFAAAAGAGLFPALSTVDDLISKRWPYDDPQALASTEKLVGSSSRIALVLGVFVIVPLAREAFFRGALFGHLRRGASSAVTIAATSVLFALSFAFASADWRSLPGSLVLGLVLGCLRSWTGSVVASVIAQLAYWSVFAIPILRGADPMADVTYSPQWIAAGAALAVIVLGLTALLRHAEE